LIDYEWDFADGDAGTGVVASHIFYLPGTYMTTLTVTDNSGGTATASATIIVSDTTPPGPPTNQAPTAVISSTSVSPSSYQFNAYDSEDADGLLVSYNWNFGDGSTATDSYAEHEFATAGTYSVTLTVKDDEDATATAQTSVTVTTTASPGEAPVAVIQAGSMQYKITANWDYNDTANISAFRLYQNNSFICQTTDPNATELSCLTYFENGPMTFALTTVDTTGNESLLSNGLTYSPASTASVTLEGDAPFTLFFNGGSSSDADRTIVSYHWDFGDGDTKNTSAATHTYSIGGIYTVTLAITDDDGNTSSTTTTVTVHGNTPPVALATTINAIEDTPATGTLMAADADNDPLTYTIAVNGSKGKAVITNSTTGAFTYTPAENANGTDTLTFLVHDGEVYSNIATATVNIAPVNDPPVITPVAITTAEDTPATGVVTATDVDNNSLTFTIGSNGIMGTAIITNQQTGAFTYTPNANQNGVDSFTVNVSDGFVTKSATVNITITPVNDAPTAMNDAAATTSGVSVTINVLQNDSDIDGDRLSLLQVQAAAHGTTSISGSGIVYTSQASFSGNDTFTYTVTDNNGKTALATVTVAVKGNTPPVAIATTLNANEDTPVTGTLKASDTDGDPLTYSIAVNGSKGTAIITNINTGAFSYTPAANANGTDTFTFVVNDDKAYSNIATATVNIAPVNDPPVVTSPVAVTTAEDTPASGVVTATDPDDDPLAFTIGSNGSLGTAIITNQQTGVFTYTPKANQYGVDSFTVNVNDGSVTKIATVSVTITPVNNAPKAVSDKASTRSGRSVTIYPLKNDTDIEGDALSLVQVQPAAHGTTSISGVRIIYKSEVGFRGNDTFTYTVRDAKGGTAVGIVTVTVR
ncbi:MAG: Ig-like domain-containing protein, partial [Desulfobulbaceae bacterium]|nr:Ig-like domain-containing protein [Desulfobulbaceae bacterium]